MRQVLMYQRRIDLGNVFNLSIFKQYIDVLIVWIINAVFSFASKYQV